MGAALAANLPAARELFDRASAILQYDLLAICTQGPAERLDSTVHSQPALFVCSLAALEQLRADSPEVVAGCDVVAGLSLGEYTALVFSEALDFEAGLRLVKVRGEAMQEASDLTPSAMVSILGLGTDEVEALCAACREDQVLQTANFLCPGNIVVSGHRAACARVARAAEAAGAMKVIPLAVAGAFHTPLMQPAMERLEAALRETTFRAPRIPVVSNVDAQPHTTADELPELLRRQVVSPVLWEASMRWLLDEARIDQAYEIGPGRVLRGLLKRISRKFPCAGVEA
jgi:[acyl-carrier-protein] S-malonyltransferase